MEELIKSNVVLVSLGLMLSGFLAGLATYRAVLEIARLKVISLTQWESVESLLGVSSSVGGNASPAALSNEEQILLRELVGESKGIGDSVAVYPFESNIRKFGMTRENASLTIASLQNRGFVAMDEQAGHDDLRNKASMYPVYRVTKDGFRWALQNRR